MPYRVYVISLNKEVLKSKKFRKRNPDYIEGKPCYCVGITTKDPSERALQHRDAARNEKGPLYSKLAHKYYNGLTKKFSSLKAVSGKKKAEKLEADVARKLQAKGCGVWWN
ncbi:hypothetical protein [Gilvibacter sp.]|uniref:hypothetical protein n=1 Tax=Gilvibacter sp. TaxID=2729997 RepID=UPI003B51D6C5